MDAYFCYTTLIFQSCRIVVIGDGDSAVGATCHQYPDYQVWRKQMQCFLEGRFHFRLFSGEQEMPGLKDTLHFQKEVPFSVLCLSAQKNGPAVPSNILQPIIDGYVAMVACSVLPL